MHARVFILGGWSKNSWPRKRLVVFTPAVQNKNFVCIYECIYVCNCTHSMDLAQFWVTMTVCFSTVCWYHAVGKYVGLV